MYIDDLRVYNEDRALYGAATPEGYIADKKQLRRLLAQDQTTVPQTYRERSFYIIRRFLLDNADYLDLYELCDELYISYSLLKNDIQKMNVSFAFLHIRFYSRDDCLYIQGSEKDKRKGRDECKQNRDQLFHLTPP